MPQLGLHLSLGLLATRPSLRRRPWAGLGFLVGSGLPDIDFAFLIPHSISSTNPSRCRCTEL